MIENLATYKNRAATQESAKQYEPQSSQTKLASPNSTLKDLSVPNTISAIDPRMQPQNVFYNLGRELTWYLASTSFSNELPKRLTDKHILSERDKLLNSDRFFTILKASAYDPIRSKLTLSNCIILLRNILAVIEQVPKFVLASFGPKCEQLAFKLFQGRLRQFHKRPAIKYFKKYLIPNTSSNTLSQLGKTFATHIPEKTFIDLASGDPNRAVAHRVIAQNFGAIEYIGVEIENLPLLKRTFRKEFPQLTKSKDFTAKYVKTDILSFLKNYERSGPIFLRIEGLEIEDKHEDNEKLAHEYLKEVLENIETLTQPGDILSIGRVVSILTPKPTQIPKTEYQQQTFDLILDPADYGFALYEGKLPKTIGITSNHERLWVKCLFS